MCQAAPVSVFSNGFEADTAGWVPNGSTITRVTSGTGGIPSANGGHHATVSSGGGVFTRWAEYRTVFPTGGYTATAKIYLNTSGGWANDVRFDWTVASNQTVNSHRRDFVFNVGFYNASDMGSPGAGSDRFIVSASNSAGRANAYPKNPARSPIAITASGWYTFEHSFQDNGGGVLQVVMTIRDSSNAVVGTWALSDPSDVIGSNVGGNRYGWLTSNEFTTLAMDQTGLEFADSAASPAIVNATRGWRHATIQSGVTNAVAGDVIQVPPGNYTGNVLIDKNLMLESTGGRAVTTITGVSGVGSLGAVMVTNNTTAVTLGGDDKGFKIIGIDNGSPGLENAALYFQGGHTGVQVIDNEIVANGDGGLISEYGATVSGWLIDGNIFSGQTFTGPNPADNGFANQFTTPNVPRQLVLMGNGGGNLATATATNITFTNNQITGTAGGLNISSQEQGNQLVTLDVANSTITGNTFQGTTTRFAGSLRVRRPITTISGNSFVSTGLGLNTSQLFVQNNTTTLQDIVAANTFDKGAFVDGGTTVWVGIQSGIDSVTAGSVLRVLAGTYESDILLNKLVTVRGAGAGSSILVGQTGGDGATVRMSATGAVIEGFSITREGNNTTDWNDPGLNSAGVAAQSVNGVIIRNNTIEGNRSGIDINNCSGHQIHNNVISNNRTGVIFRNQTDSLTFVENTVTGNWTVGIVFLDGSGGTNSPPQSALSSFFFNNNISGNWYGQVVDRQAGGALPAPGTTNLKNFSGNWFGSTSPTFTTSNSVEPGYAAQIPVAFGGGATPPAMPEPDLLGAASANLDITPLLTSGSDTNVETTLGRGTHGFQGNFGSLLFTGVLAQTGALSRFYEAIEVASSGGSITTPGIHTLLLNSEITKSVAFTGSYHVNSASLPLDGSATDVLTSFMTRATGATVTVDVLGMNANQLAAVTANLAGFVPFAYPPVLVLASGTPTGYFNAIQAGVNFASSGNVVRVSPGNYTENVLINKNLTLESTGGRAVTTITGISGAGVPGAVRISGTTTAVTLGGDDKGFKIIGIDNGSPGLENAAVYVLGVHSGLQVLDNEIQANGDHALVAEFGATISGWLIDGNIFSGQTFVGPNPADNGFANQFTTPNVPRQLVVLGNGGGNLATAAATNITFTNNQITGTAGGLNISSQEQGNQLVTLDVAGSTITGNTFQGTTTRFAGSLRVRRPNTTISGNSFVSTGLGLNTSQLFVQNNTTTLQDIVAANTFDKGAFINGSTTVAVSIQNIVNSAASGSTIRVLAGTYGESVSTSGNSVLLSPALLTSQIILNGSLTLDANDSLVFDINGPLPGTGYDQWQVNGTATLGGAALSLLGSHVPVPNQSFTLISNDLMDAVAGIFSGLPEGALLNVNGINVTLTYAGGPGANDVILTYVPEIAVEQPAATDRPDGSLVAVTFPDTNIAETSSLTFTLKNTGTGPLSIGTILFDTAQASEFEVTTPPPVTLAQGADATFVVSFTPLDDGERTTWMRITNGDADEDPFDIRLSGNATIFIGTEWNGTDPVVDTPGAFDATGLTFDIDLGFVPVPDVPLTLVQADGGVTGEFNDLPNGGVVAMAINGVIYYFQVDYGSNDITLTPFTPSGPPAWKWTAGPKARNGIGIFGTKGTGADASNPGARQGAMNWRGQDGSLWMFGGYGYAQSVTNPPRYLNDLWQYDRENGQWIWQSGANVHNQFGNYTDAILANRTPGSRHSGTTWTDSEGSLWLFGGHGIGTTPGLGRLNDLWRFDTGTLLWTHMKGGNVTGAAGVYGPANDPANTPGARQGATGWATPGFLWLFGGTTDGGTTHHNDLWRYSIASGNWTVIKGSATTNLNGTYAGAPAANTPGARRDATGWVAKDNKLWLFGGSGLAATGTTLGDMSDLWSFDPVTGNWTHISGPTTQGDAGTYTALNAAGTPAARSAGSGWVTVDGDLWLVGGFKDSNQSYNDVWIYDIGTGVWTWKLGSNSLNAPGSHGTLGEASPSNSPGGRFTPSTWVTLNGSLWIFGGGGADGFGNTGRLSDLWTYGIPNPPGAPWDEAIPAPFPDEFIVNADPNTSDATAGTMAYVPISGQLNGSDPDGDKLLFSTASSSILSQGTLTLNANGTWTYVPAMGFTGLAAFQFKANDNYGGESPVRTLIITVSTHPADSDGNGIADSYELTTFGKTGIAADGDADLDGQSNYFEFLAGTSPLDPNERLATAPSVAGAGAVNGSIKLQLTHVRPGVNYHLETSSDLDVWTRLGTFTFSVAGSAEIEDPTPATGAPKFYRMNLEATPAVILP